MLGVRIRVRVRYNGGQLKYQPHASDQILSGKSALTALKCIIYLTSSLRKKK